MGALKITDILSLEEIVAVRRTIGHFMQHPDYATGEETGRTFRKLACGQPLPLEIVLRDWQTGMDERRGGRDLRNGDCYRIYLKVYENPAVTITDVDPLLGTAM